MVSSNEFGLSGAFGVFEKLMAAPLPSDIIAPVWPWQSSWTAWEASTHHLRHVRSLADRLSFMWRVPRRLLEDAFKFTPVIFVWAFYACCEEGDSHLVCRGTGVGKLCGGRPRLALLAGI